MISCQVALYPLSTGDFDKVIVKALESIQPLKEKGLTIEVGAMSTILKGSDELVWDAVRILFNESSKNGQQIVLNAQISNECGCDR